MTKNWWRLFGLGTTVLCLVCCDARAASSVPKLDAGPSCKAAAAVSVVAGRDVQACLGDENQAKEQMTKNWSQYRDADKAAVYRAGRKGGPVKLRRIAYVP